MSEPILVVRSSRTKYILFLLVAIGFVAGGVFLVARGSGADTWVGWMSIVFFGAGIPLFVRQLFDSKPRIILDDSGVFDRTLGVGRIPWSEIKGVLVKSVHGNSFVCLVLTDPQRWVEKLSAVQRKLVQANEALGFQPLNINLSGTSVDPVVVQDIVLKKYGIRVADKRIKFVRCAQPTRSGEAPLLASLVSQNQLRWVD